MSLFDIGLLSAIVVAFGIFAVVLAICSHRSS